MQRFGVFDVSNALLLHINTSQEAEPTANTYCGTAIGRESEID